MSYQAFISYSHAADGKLAPALQSGLQKIAKPFYRLRAMRVFRDETSLQLTPKLWPVIRQALGESEHFILMASEAAARSEWVQKEIEEWLAFKKDALDRFSIVLTGGEIVWDKKLNDFDWERTSALPEILRGKFETEPLYLDFRWARESEQLSVRNPQFLNAVGKLAAAIRGEDLDNLVGEDVRQHRIFKEVATALILLLLLLLGATGIAAFQAYAQAAIAREQAAIANEQRERAENATRDAETQRDDAIKARNEAKTALDRETEAKNLADTRRKEADEARKNETAAKNQAEERREQAEQATENERVAKNEAEERRKEAEIERTKATDALRAAYIENGRQELINSYPFRAAAYLNAAYQMSRPIEDSEKRSTLEFLLRQALAATDSLRFSLYHQGAVYSAKFSQDGSKIVTASADNTARVWNSKTGKLLALLNHDGPVWSAEFSPDGKKIVTASFEDKARLWDAETGKLLFSLDHEKSVWSAVFSSDGSRVVTASGDGTSKIWDVETGKVTTSLRHGESVWRAVFSSDGRKVASASEDMVTVWDVETGKPLVLAKHRSKVYAVVFSPDGRRFATACSDNMGRIWDSLTGNLIASFNHQSPVHRIAFSPDGKDRNGGL